SRALNRKRSDIGGFSSMPSTSPVTASVMAAPLRNGGARTRDTPGRSLACLGDPCGPRRLVGDRRLERRREELVADGLERAVGLHLLQGVVDGCDEVRALREDEPELLGGDA